MKKNMGFLLSAAAGTTMAIICRLVMQYAVALRRFYHPKVLSLKTLLLLAGTLIMTTAIMSLVLRYVPEAKGSDGDQLKHMLRTPQKKRWYVLLGAKFIGLLTAMVSGLMISSDLAVLFMAVCLAEGLAKTLQVPASTRSLMAACAMTAALSACFLAPMASIVFFYEAFRERDAWDFLPALILSALIGWLTAGMVFGYHPYLALVSDDSFGVRSLVPIATLVFVTGLAGFGYRWLLRFLSYLHARMAKLKLSLRLFIPVLLSGAAYLAFVAAWPACDLDAFPLVWDSYQALPLQVVVWMLLYHYTLCALASASDAPSGHLLMLLVIGAGIGALMALVFRHTQLLDCDIVLLMIIGAGCFFASAKKLPVTAICMMMEMMRMSLLQTLLAIVAVGAAYTLTCLLDPDFKVYKTTYIPHNSERGMQHERY